MDEELFLLQLATSPAEIGRLGLIPKLDRGKCVLWIEEVYSKYKSSRRSVLADGEGQPKDHKDWRGRRTGEMGSVQKRRRKRG